MIQRKNRHIKDAASESSVCTIDGISSRNFFDTLNAFLSISSKLKFDNAGDLKCGIFDVLSTGTMRAGLLWRYNLDLHVYTSHDVKQISVKKHLFKKLDRFLNESASQVVIFTFYREDIRYSLIIPSEMIRSDMTDDDGLMAYIFAVNENAYADSDQTDAVHVEEISADIIDAVTRNNGKFTASDIHTVTLR